MMDQVTIKKLIENGLPDSTAYVEGDDGTHFQAVIVCDAFAGKNMVQQHQLVYKALGALMGKEIHALSIQTLTPQEWQAKQT
jgi:acid stress-induced BolA-like protein IbaG/YrbA